MDFNDFNDFKIFLPVLSSQNCTPASELHVIFLAHAFNAGGVPVGIFTHFGSTTSPPIFILIPQQQ